MKILGFNPYFKASHIDFIMLLTRLVIGIFMLTHGLAKLDKFNFDGVVQFPDPIGFGSHISLMLVIFAEIGASVFIIFGLATRLMCIPLFITMFVAAFVVHANDGFGKQELALLYMVFYVIIFVIGPGIYSIDYYINKK